MNLMAPDGDQQIRQVIRDCGLQIEILSAQQFEISEKGPEDYVTSIDAALDKQLSDAFTELFPQDGVITEEDGESRSQFHGSYDRLWCIDPLDGTEDFIYGRQSYSVMVGLLKHHQPLAGWVYAPATDQLYFGGPDWGLFQTSGDGLPVPLSVVEPKPPISGFCPILIGHRDQARYGAAIAEYIPEAQFYSLGSFGLKVLDVIQGRAGLYLYLNKRVKVWDTVGPLALAKTAGLICCTLEGDPISFLPNAIDSESLAHQQSIIVGWPSYVEALRPRLEASVGFASQA